jgi:hypothetical protein
MKTLILLAVVVLCLGVGAMWVWGFPGVQKAYLYGDLTSSDATFSLGTYEGGTYKVHFVLVQPNVFQSYMVDFYRDGTFYAGREFMNTSSQCDGATTVSLPGGHSYRMHIEYAVGGGQPSPGTIAWAEVLYTCNQQ